MAILSGRYTVPTGAGSYSDAVPRVLKMCLQVAPQDRATLDALLDVGITAGQGVLAKASPSARSLRQAIMEAPSASGGVGMGAGSGGGTAAAAAASSRPPRPPVAAAGRVVTTFADDEDEFDGFGDLSRDTADGGSTEAADSGRRGSAVSPVGWAATKESVKTRMMAMFGKAASEPHRWVLKATSMQPGPPKAKYVRFLIVHTAERSSLDVLAKHLPSRPVASDIVVACKSVGLVLKVLQMVRGSVSSAVVGAR